MLYTLAKWEDDVVIVADKRLGELHMRTGSKFKKLMSFKGEKLTNMILEHPTSEDVIPILVNNEVKSDYGSGIEGVSPAHDIEDIEVAQNYGLEREGLVDTDGFLVNQSDIFNGLNVLDEETNSTIEKILKKERKVVCRVPTS